MSGYIYWNPFSSGTLISRNPRKDNNMKNIKPKLVCALFAASVLATACNTIDGVGQDIQSAGKKTSETAEKVKK